MICDVCGEQMRTYMNGEVIHVCMKKKAIPKSCDACRWYSCPTGQCGHPITELMRSMIKEGQLPTAFKEVEVTLMQSTGGQHCPAYGEKP